MHKDRPPGVFDIINHSTTYVIVLGLLIGFAASILVFTGYALNHDHVTKTATSGEPASQFIRH